MCVILVTVINILFFVSSNKQDWDGLNSSSFECGYSSYFFSHFSFSVHYFLVALIFLFLDLELCFLMPFFNDSIPNFVLEDLMYMFVLILLMGLVIEWKESKLEWV
uniref:NADH-ubiquinone oxidoreductase chain 3 n=1 Tax=Rhinotergum shaoguanense TaxID=1452699 RepID=A0A1S5XVX4_9ACAR|nr:NADH dehydrogenase subunit 3 [Rhinotergum shaoguanense]AQQ72851.1 NADH dehydrogenase subunit 3 [Rhinotergum shaoguanense]